MYILTTNRERPVEYVPKHYIIGLVLFLALQVIFHLYFIKPQLKIEQLTKPANSYYYLLPALSDNIIASKTLMLWLQAFDNQPGVSLSFKELNYSIIKEWLGLIQSLDNKSQYPLLTASRVYSRVDNTIKKKIMLDFVKDEYLKKPNQRWRWMAYCVYVAKYELKDLDLALSFAKLLRENTSYDAAPAWATQMELFILEELDQLESAKILIGGFLESGEIKDEHELRFLHNRLSELESKLKD